MKVDNGHSTAPSPLCLSYTHVSLLVLSFPLVSGNGQVRALRQSEMTTESTAMNV